MPRKRLAAFGVRGGRRVIVSLDGDRTVVEWYVGGRPRRKFFAGTKAGQAEAKAYARGWYENPPASAQSAITVRQLWELYWEAMVVGRDLRPKTQIGYRRHYARIELHVGADTEAEDVTMHQLDTFWAKMLALKAAPNQVRNTIATLQRAFRWAESRELIHRNRIAAWQAPKGPQYAPRKVAEYREDDVEKILRQLDPQNGWDWRAHSALLLMAEHGFRVNATLHLRWRDVDLERRVVTLPAAFDKTHRTFARPLTPGGYAAFLTAAIWRERLQPANDWVFFKGKGASDGPYTYGALHKALEKAEQAAGVKHLARRAAHGLRRMVVGNVRAVAGDAALALLWVGDTDLRQSASYIREREDEMIELAEKMGEER